jgi:hypothetical protein
MSTRIYWARFTLHSCLFNRELQSVVINICFIIQDVPEERSIFWEIIVSVIPSEKCIFTCVLFRTVSEIETFCSTVPKLLIKKRYYVLFIIPAFIVQVAKLVQFS